MKWSNLFERVLLHVPGCPEPLVENMLRQAAIEFCRESHVWSEQIGSVYPVKGITRYQIDPPEEAQIVAIEEIGYRRQYGFEPLHRDDWPSINAFGLLTFKSQPTANKGPLEIHVILAPAEDATEIIDQYGYKYKEGLIYGAVSMLQMMPNKDWSNPQLGMLNEEKFETAYRKARFRRVNGETERQMRVTPRHLL